MYLYFSFLYFDRSSSSPDMASSGTEKSAPFDLTPQSEFSSQESLLIETRLLTQVCSQTTYKTADLSGCYSSWVEFSVWSKLIYILSCSGQICYGENIFGKREYFHELVNFHCGGVVRWSRTHPCMINDNNNEDFYCASATISPAGFLSLIHI